MRAINPKEHALSFLSKVIAISQPAIRSLSPEDSYPTIAKGSPHPTKRNRWKVEVVNPNCLGINASLFHQQTPTDVEPSAPKSILQIKKFLAMAMMAHSA